jgi:integrase
VAWIERRCANDGTVTWYVFWREAGRGSYKRSLKAGARRRDAERLAIEIQARVNAGLVGGGVVAKRATLAEFARRWLAARLVRPTTFRRDEGLIKKYLIPTFGNQILNSITAEEIRTLLARVSKEQSPSTARRLLAVLSKMLRDAARSDYVRQNPVDKLDRSDKPQSRKLAKAIDLDELLAVVKALPHRWATFGLVKVLTGLRWGEIASLEWTDVDFQTGKINVQRATPAGTSGAGDPKSLTSRRSVDMLWPVKQALLDMPQRGRLVFPGVRGGPLSYGWFSRYVWRPAAAEAGSRLRLHGLRHGFASLLLAWEEPILYVSQQLGHSSAGFTLSTYAHLIQQGRKLDKETTLRKLATAAHRPRFPRVPQRRLVENPKAPKTTEK